MMEQSNCDLQLKRKQKNNNNLQRSGARYADGNIGKELFYES